MILLGRFKAFWVMIYLLKSINDDNRAQVISLGDARSYYLSTAKNELGVVFASSVAGHTMIPISWEQMICPVTKVFLYIFRQHY